MTVRDKSRSRNYKKKQAARAKGCAGGRFFSYWKHSFLKRRHQIISNQPTMIPEGMVTMIQITNLRTPPFLSQVLHLTTISTTQFTPGMRRRIICTRRGSLLNQVIFPLQFTARRRKAQKRAQSARFSNLAVCFLHFAVPNGKKNLFCRTKKIFARSIDA